MPQYKIKWLPQAFADLKRIHLFFKKKLPPAALNAVSVIHESIELLETVPKLGKELSSKLEPFRDLIISFGKGDFIIRYRLEENTVVITYLWHSREDDRSR